MEIQLVGSPQQSLKSLIDDMNAMHFYLFGSREMLQNFNLEDPTDWDFLGHDGLDWNREVGQTTSPLWLGRHLYLKTNFDHVECRFEGKIKRVDKMGGGYHGGPPPDNSFSDLLRHKVHKNVTVVVRKDADIYQKMWENLDFNFWHTNLWKSHPHSYYKYDKYGWKATARKIFNMLMDKQKAELTVNDLL